MRLYHCLNLISSVFILSSCALLSPHSTEAQSTQYTVEDALQLKDDGKAAEAAGILLQISESAADSTRGQYLFDAAQLYLQVPDAAQFTAILQRLETIAPASSYTRILSAQISLHNGNPDKVLVQLTAFPLEKDVTSSAKSAYWLTVAQASELSFKLANNAPQDIKKSARIKNKTASSAQLSKEDEWFLRALHARTQAEEFLSSPSELSHNQESIWQLMSAQPVNLLRTLKAYAPNKATKAWLDLGILAKESKGKAREINITRWRAKYPDQAVLNQRLLELRGQNIENLHHLALILPTKSADLGPSAKAVWEGFQAAHKQNPISYPVKLYETNADSTVTLRAYESAVDKGASLIIGPLPRKSLSLLAQKKLLAVPTIALNVIDQEKTPVNLYQFGLSVAQEAQLIARAAEKKGFTEALVLKGTNTLDVRSAEAFTKEWLRLRHGIKAELSLQDVMKDTDTNRLLSKNMTAKTMVFIASDFPHALPVIQALPSHWVIFGTSALNTISSEASKLDKEKKIYFVDAPALVKTASSVNKTATRIKGDIMYSRLYSLGTDVHRLTSLLLRDEIKFNRPLVEGETGKLRVTRNGYVERDLPLVLLQEASLASYSVEELTLLSNMLQR